MTKQVLFVGVLVVLAASTVCAQGTFTGLGSPNTYVGGMSADGRVIVGSRSQFGPVWRWEGTSVVDIGGAGATAKISRDGKVIISDAKDSNGVRSAAIWQGATSWRILGGIPNGKPLDNVSSTAYDLNADGSIVVGLAWHSSGASHGFRWDRDNGMVDLGALQAESSRANAISGDGQVIVGWDENPNQNTDYNSWRGTVWTEKLERLMHPMGFVGQSEGVNHDGMFIVGRGHPNNYKHAYLYDLAGGRIRDLGAIPRGTTPNQKLQEDQSIAFAVSDDGSVVVGQSGWQPPLDAFIWHKGNGKMMKLSTYLLEKGVTGFEKWTLVGAYCLSPDGKIIAGTGINPRGLAEGWIVRLQ